MIYSLELNRVVANIKGITEARGAAYNKITQLTAMTETSKIGKFRSAFYILDKNFEITHSCSTTSSYYKQIAWIDEYSFALSEYSALRIGDIRMNGGIVNEFDTGHKSMGVRLYDHLGSLGKFSTGYHAIQVDDRKRLACIWNVKDLTWSNVLVLPDDVATDSPMCNSRYAAFTKKGGICLFDFDHVQE